MEPHVPPQEPRPRPSGPSYDPYTTLFPDEDERTTDSAPEPIGAWVVAAVVVLAGLLLLAALLLERVP